MYRYYDWRKEIDNSELQDVIRTINNDGVVIFPTETVYGIGGNAFSEKVVDRIYFAKNRPREKAVNIMVSDISKIKQYAYISSELEQRIIKNCMPGPLTIILKRKEHFGGYFTAGNSTIGIRIPDNNIAKTILDNIEVPLIAPSANISNEPSGIDPDKIKNDFEDTVDIIINGGIMQYGQSSTIVRVENDEIIILRQGAITKQDIIDKINKL